MSDLRPDLALVSELIPANSRVLDLGCGDGALLSTLAEKGCHGTGVEIDADRFAAALRNGVSVIDLDLNNQLCEFADDSYDIAVLSGTLQNLESPVEVLRQISRIARQLVVSMPNFAYWRNRLRLLGGRMPVSKDLPFQWYNTPNIHYTSLADLEPLFARLGLTIEQCIPLDASGAPHKLRAMGNLLASSAIYQLRANR